MNRRILAATLLAAAFVVAGIVQLNGQQTAPRGAAAKGTPMLKTVREQASYAIGLEIGGNLASGEADVDPDLIARGIRDAIAGGEKLLTDEEVQKAMTEFSRQMQSKMQAKAKSAGDKNQKEGETFLAANAKKPGVKSTESGLQYKVLKAGDGASPKKTDTVRVHYHGTLTNGEVFDSSVERKEPAEFPVNRVIPGWTEALQMMKVGDKWEIVIPPDLAYGPQGTPGGPIGPNSVLVFQVELLDIVK